MRSVQTKKDIVACLESRGLRPRHRFGQNFLIDGNLMRRLVEASEARQADGVLEVGGGTGGLTDLLLERGCRVACVEIDRDLSEVLRDRFTGQERFELITGDALKNKNQVHPAVLSAIERLRVDAETRRGRVMLVANLPYQIATPLILNLLLEAPCVRRLCFTVQAEVGERILAGPGCRDYGPISVVMQACCALQVTARVPASAFWPAPQVESMMLRADVRDDGPVSAASLAPFASFVRKVFEHRRKTLRASLAYVIDKIAVQRLATRLDLGRRAEELNVEEWAALFNPV